MRDPRSHKRYRNARADYIARHGAQAPCVLCGNPIDLALPGSHKWGPTIEHRVPVRHLRQMARTDDELLDLACDQRTWGLAHLACQRRQGGPAGLAARKPKTQQAQAFQSRW